MATKCERDRVRIKLDVLLHTLPSCDLRSGDAKIWRGTDCQIELGLFFGGTIIDDFTNLTSFHFDIVRNDDRDSDPLVQKTILIADLKAITSMEWDGKTAAKYTALVLLTKAETQLLLSAAADNTDAFFCVAYSVTNDATPRYITYGGFVLTIEEDGVQNGLTVLPQAPAWRISDGELQLWNPDQSKWHTIYVRGAAGAEQIVPGAGES